MPRTELHLGHMRKHLARPLLHLNGTSKESLTDNWIAADDAICTALKTIHETAPNMRDYYPQFNGDNEYKLAREQHQARVDALANIRLELNALIEHLEEP